MLGTRLILGSSSASDPGHTRRILGCGASTEPTPRGPGGERVPPGRAPEQDAIEGDRRGKSLNGLLLYARNRQGGGGVTMSRA
jgi:hypothetical protein